MSRDKYFVEQTLINLFRNRKPPQKSELKNSPSKAQSPARENPCLKDVIDYKKVLECKINEADMIEKEEKLLLETRLQEIKTVFLPESEKKKTRDLKAKMLEEQYKRDLEKLDRDTDALIEQEKEFVFS